MRITDIEEHPLPFAPDPHELSMLLRPLRKVGPIVYTVIQNNIECVIQLRIIEILL